MSGIEHLIPSHNFIVPVWQFNLARERNSNFIGERYYDFVDNLLAVCLFWGHPVIAVRGVAPTESVVATMTTRTRQQRVDIIEIQQQCAEVSAAIIIALQFKWARWQMSRVHEVPSRWIDRCTRRQCTLIVVGVNTMEVHAPFVLLVVVSLPFCKSPTVLSVFCWLPQAPKVLYV